jgi:chaperonin GroEL
MSLFQTAKPKSAGKIMVPSSDELQEEVLATLAYISKMVGATLGPGGKQVLIERPEINMKPIVSKDGVTVIKNLGFDSAVKQLILESARDASTRTATEAGDGTTTATILSFAIAESIAEVVSKNNRVSPQRIVREMQALVPLLMKKIDSFKIEVNGDNYSEVLTKVATLSGNGDNELAKSIIDAMDLVGEEGNMTIVESQGASKISIERVNGYSIETGYEQSCRNSANGFINDKTGTMVALNNPLFILFDGVINDMSQVFDAMSKLGNAIKESGRGDNGAILVAHGFGESFLGDLHVNWVHPNSLIKIFPVLTPETPIWNGKTNFLYDLQAYTGSPVFNPVDNSLNDMDCQALIANSRVKKFESSRFKSIVIANEDADALAIRVDELKALLEKPESELDIKDLNLRIGKLTSGIARLNISGPSAGETRERRDRAEDAWMAVKGAIKHGAVPGGGFVLVKMSADLYNLADKVVSHPKKLATAILAAALLEPVRVLYKNYGYVEKETEAQIYDMLKNESQTFDIPDEKWVDKFDLLDSLPAIAEAVRNSISIASLLGTLGGIIAFKRDADADREEERFVRRFQASIGERGSVSTGEQGE